MMIYNYFGTLLFLFIVWAIGLSLLKVSKLSQIGYHNMHYISVPIGIATCAVIASALYLALGCSMELVRVGYAVVAVAAGVVLVWKKVEKREWIGFAVMAGLFSIMILPGVIHGDKYYVHRGNIYDQYFYLAEVVYMSLHDLQYGISEMMEAEYVSDVLVSGYNWIHSDRPVTPLLCASLCGKSWGNVFFQAYLFLMLALSSVFGAMKLAWEMLTEKTQAVVNKRKKSKKVLPQSQISLRRKELIGSMMALLYVWGFYGQIQYDIDAWSQLVSMSGLVTFACLYFVVLSDLLNGRPALAVGRYLVLLLLGTGLFLMYPENTILHGGIVVVISVVMWLAKRCRISWKTLILLASLPVGIIVIAALIDFSTVEFALIQIDTSGSDVRQSWASYFDRYWLGYHTFAAGEGMGGAVKKLLSFVVSVCGMFMITPDHTRVSPIVVQLWVLVLAVICVCIIILLLQALRTSFRNAVQMEKRSMLLGFALIGLAAFGFMVLREKYWSAGKLLLYVSPYLYLLLAEPLGGALLKYEVHSQKHMRRCMLGVSGLFVACQLLFAGLRIYDTVVNEDCTGYLGNYPSDQAPYLKQTFSYDFEPELYREEDVLAIVVEDPWYQDYVKIALTYEGIAHYAVPDSVFDRPTWKEEQGSLGVGDKVLFVE